MRRWMVALLLAAALLGCGFPHGAGDDSSDGEGDGVEADSPDDDGGSSMCDTIASRGPSGQLVAFEVASDGTQWLLTHPPDSELTTLWENRGASWQQRPIDGGCRRGVLAVDRFGRANVACAVGNPTLADYDIRLFVFDAQTISSRLVLAATTQYQYTQGGFPSSIVLDANGLANVLWQATYRGRIDIEFADFYLSKDLGSSWSMRHLLPLTFDGHNRNDHVRIVSLGSELYLVFRQTTYIQLVVARVTPSGYERVAELRTPTNLAWGFAFDYELMKTPDNKLHLGLADDTEYADVDAPGLVFYHPDVAGDPDRVIDVDGVAPFGDGQAGLGGLSMAFDPTGAPMFSYAQEATRSLRVSRRTPAGSWQRMDLVTGTSVGDSALRFDAEGTLHVAYEDVETGEIDFVDEACMQ